MSTPEELHAALRAHLATITSMAGYDGDVPPNVPTATDGSDRALPYYVLWPSPGANPQEAAVADVSGALDWAVQVTVAAGDITWLLRAVKVVRDTAAGTVLVDGDGPLVDETPVSQTVLRDPDSTSPPRWYVPLFFRCLTA